MKENHKVDELLGNIAKLKSAIDEKDEIIEGLRNSLTETQLHLKKTIEEKDAVMVGLKESKEESGDVIQGLNESITETQLHLKTAIEEKDEVITGLNESLKETEEYLEKSIKEWKKTVDEIYNSTTWKMVSKFTKAQTKRK